MPQLHPDPADEPLELGRLTMIKIPVLVIKPACDYLPWSSIAAYQCAFPQAKFVMLPAAGRVAYLEQPELMSASSTLFSPASNCLCRPLTRHPSQTDTVALGDGVYPWP